MKTLKTTLAVAVTIGSLAFLACAEEPAKSRADLREPVFRVTKQERSIPTKTASAAIVSAASQTSLATNSSPAAVEPPADSVVATSAPIHPLVGPLEMASKALDHSQKNVSDYTAVLVKRERVSGKLNDPQYMFVKVRNQKKLPDNTVQTPFSFYIKFLMPSNVKGREVIYVDGQNGNKLIAHEGGLRGRFTPCLHLDPHGALAMMGQRYPATDIGIENLCYKLTQRGKRDIKMGGECVVSRQPAVINKRPVTRIEVTHMQKLPHLDFHKARIYVDDAFGLPVRYEAYDWPTSPSGEVSENELIEEYTYVKLKFNVGLSDEDFDPANTKYNMK